MAIWIAFVALAFNRSFYLQGREQTNLRLALALSALFLVLSTAALASFSYRVIKVMLRSLQFW